MQINNRLISTLDSISPGFLRRPRLTLLAGLLMGVLAGLSSVSAAHAVPTGTYQGNAYATDVNVSIGPIAATLGKTAYIACSCVGTNGETLSNNLNALSVGLGGNILKSGTLLSTAYTAETATANVVRNTSIIQGLSLLNGLITADAIVSVANTAATDTAVVSNDNGSTFANLKIAGKAIDVNVAPNTTVALPGIGNVILRKTTKAGNGTSNKAIVVEMLAINVTLANSFNLPVGAQIVVSHAASGFFRTSSNVAVSGAAYVTYANAAAGNLLQTSIGLTAATGVACQGSGGKTLTSAVADIKVANILSLGTGKTTAFGETTTTGGTAKTTAAVENLGLLNGLIGATAITASAQTTITNGVRTRSTNGTSFAGLTILGVNLPINIKPNSKILLPLLGFVILNEQIIPPATSTAPTQVNGLHIHITTANSLGLPVGAELIVGHASASTQNF